MPNARSFDNYVESIQSIMECFAKTVQSSDMSSQQKLEAMELIAETAQQVAEAHVYMT